MRRTCTLWQPLPVLLCALSLGACGARQSDAALQRTRPPLAPYPNLLMGCDSQPACDALLNHVPSWTQPTSERTELYEAVLRTTLALMWLDGMKGNDWMPCLGLSTNTPGYLAPDPSIVKAVAETGRPVASAGDCGFDNHGLPLHLPSRRQAIYVYVERPDRDRGPRIHGDTATAIGAYYAAMLAGAGYECTYVRGERTWYATRCLMAWIS